MEPINVCLIGGSGRSGTTILKDTFARHPDVVAIGHSRLMTDPDGLVDFHNTFLIAWSPFLYDLKIRRLQKFLMDVGETNLLKRVLHKLNRVCFPLRFPFVVSPAYAHASFARDCPDYFRLVEELIQDLIDCRYDGYWGGSRFLQPRYMVSRHPFQDDELTFILRIFLRRVIFSVLKKGGTKYFVEDTPWNLLFFDNILKILPESKLVHIYRDPRDAVSSFMNQSWSPSDPIVAARWYKGIMERWQAVRSVLPPGSFMEIALESLVQGPEEVLRKLCGFWNMRWDASLLTTDLSHSHTGRWKRDLSPEAQDAVQDILREHIAALGY